MTDGPLDRPDSESPTAPPPEGWAEAWPLLRVAPRRAKVWALVLEARGVPYRLRREWRRTRFFVPRAWLPRAEAEVAAYEAENKEPPRSFPIPEPYRNFWVVAGAFALLALFDSLTASPFLAHLPWEAAGAANSSRMLAGEWWRAVTALTLHADELHLAGNVVIGAIVASSLSERFGAGGTFFLLLLAGTAGNAANALYHGPGHLSVGASTAIFGGVGALAAAALLAPHGARWKSWVAPVGAGLAILAFLGGPGGRTDFGAHLFGFAAGFVLGLPAILTTRHRGRPGKLLSFLFAAATAALLAASWAAALSAGG